MTQSGEGHFLKAWLTPVPLGFCGIYKGLLSGIDSSKGCKK